MEYDAEAPAAGRCIRMMYISSGILIWSNRNEMALSAFLR